MKLNKTKISLLLFAAIFSLMPMSVLAKQQRIIEIRNGDIIIGSFKADDVDYIDIITTNVTDELDNLTTPKALLDFADLQMGRMYASENTNTIPLISDYIFSDMTVYGKTDAGSKFFDNFSENLTPTNWIHRDYSFNDGIMIGWLWDKMWDHVNAANLIIDLSENDGSLSGKEKDAYIGRAYFHRAWAYYNLCFWYGDLPLVSATAKTPKKSYYSTPIVEIMKFLCVNLKDALELVPSQKDLESCGLVSQEACRHLYVKCLLAAGDYAEAERQATILIDQSGLSLMTEPFGTYVESLAPQTWNVQRNVIWDLHRSENKMIAENKECILATEGYFPNGGNTYSHPWMRVFNPNSISNYSINTPDNKGTAQDRNTMALNHSKYDSSVDWLHAMGRGIGTIRPTYWAQHPLWNNPDTSAEDCLDLRHNNTIGNWIRMEDQTYNNPQSAYHKKNMMLYAPEDVVNRRGTIILAKGSILCGDTIRSWFDVPLYKIFHFDRRQYETEGSTDFQGAITKGDANTYIYRLAETYLLRAEARLYLGDVAGATQDVNTIRQRAQASWLYESVNIGDIMDERARELYLEEYRKAELTRVSMCLAMSGIPDEWGNTYSIEDWNKQSGTQTDGGSYWYQRLMHHSFYNKGKVGTSYGTFNYTMNKRNLFWPIPDYGQQHFRRIKQNYGYPDTTGYDKMWETWQEADEDARR